MRKHINITSKQSIYQLNQAFDSTHKSKKLKILKNKYIPSTLKKLNRMTLASSQANIVKESNMTKKFNANVGFIQGDALLAVLFSDKFINTQH
jgi:hypothetical protein